MESENKDTVPVEIQCSKCHEKAYYATVVRKEGVRYHVWACDNGHYTYKLADDKNQS